MKVCWDRGIFDRTLRLGVSGTVVAALLAASPAIAQSRQDAGEEESEGDAPAQRTAPQEGSGNEILVTGIRASVAQASDIKRNADQIVDSITAQDIGALPDRSVAETLQRIAGVSLTRTQSEFTTGRPTDPGRFAPEGGGVTIRGLTGSLSQSNGRDIFSAGNGRTLDWSDISSDLIAGVDVYKNPSAQMTEGGISGVINLRGRKPFDQRGQLISMSADVAYGDLQKKTHWSGNALYSNRWDTVGGAEIGLLVAGSINNKGTRTDSIQAGTFGPYTLTAANGGLSAGEEVYRPASLGYRTIDWFQRRVMVDGVLQFSPSPDMTFTFEAAYSKATPHEVEFADLAYSGPPAESDTWQFGPNNTVIAGSNLATNRDLDTRIGRYKLQARDF
jgi:TonB-dependent receptor